MKHDEYLDFLNAINLTEDQTVQVLVAIHGFIDREQKLMLEAKEDPELVDEYNFRRGKCAGLGLTYKLIAGTLAYTDEIDCSWTYPEDA